MRHRTRLADWLTTWPHTWALARDQHNWIDPATGSGVGEHTSLDTPDMLEEPTFCFFYSKKEVHKDLSGHHLPMKNAYPGSNTGELMVATRSCNGGWRGLGSGAGPAFAWTSPATAIMISPTLLFITVGACLSGLLEGGHIRLQNRDLGGGGQWVRFYFGHYALGNDLKCIAIDIN